MQVLHINSQLNITNYDVVGNELILSGTFTEVNGQPHELVCSIDLETFELTDYAVG